MNKDLKIYVYKMLTIMLGISTFFLMVFGLE